MVINYYKMSGDELKRIYKISGLKSEDFAAKLKLVKHQLYTQFSRGSKAIDREVEDELKANPELAKHQGILEVEPINSPIEQINSGPSAELHAKVIDMLRETLTLIKDQSATIADDNRVIKEHAEIFSNLVKQGVEDGIIVFKKQKSA